MRWFVLAVLGLAGCGELRRDADAAWGAALEAAWQPARPAQQPPE